MITVKDLTRKYGDFTAVDNISFTLRKGEITGLLGPNGAGKTTTLRMLTCYLTPTSGNIAVGNFSVADNPIEVKKIIGYLPESVPLYGDMMVYDYLKYIAEIRGMDPAKRMREISDICGLGDVMYKNINELSKGYKQRVGLAHAMFHDPEILILDEPTSGLDPNQIIEIRNLIKEIGKEKTVILSTHILTEVEATCRRVIIINSGKIVADSDVEQLKASYGNGTRVSIRVSGTDYDRLSAELKNVSGVAGIVKDTDQEGLVSATVMTSGDADIRPELSGVIVRNGWVLYEMKKESFSLEDIFRDLTKGGKQ
jgi:ABC-2 type transport system ATP-binding protein